MGALVLFVLQGVEETANWTRQKIDAIRLLLAHTTDYARDRAPTACSHELVSLIFEQPYCRIGNVVDAGLLERRAASRYLIELAEIGVLEERTAGREKLFLHPKLLALLTQDENDFEPYA